MPNTDANGSKVIAMGYWPEIRKIADYLVVSPIPSQLGHMQILAMMTEGRNPIAYKSAPLSLVADEARHDAQFFGAGSSAFIKICC